MRLGLIVAACALLASACAPGPSAPSRAGAAEPTQTAQTESAQRRCRSTNGRDAGDNVGITAQLCVSDATPRAGQPVTFTVQARDPDARLFGITGCFPNDLIFGDADMYCTGGPACAAGSGAGVAKQEGTVDAKRTHTYAKPGRYTAKLQLQSGSQCPHPYSSSATLRLKVQVQP